MIDACRAQMAQARPRVIAALTRSFRDVRLAEDGYQEACVRALVRWSEDGAPRDPTAWMIRVARNLTIDRLRREGRERDLDQVEHELFNAEFPPGFAPDIAERLDRDEMRDDVLRLLFMCCHPELRVQDQLALALKVVAGLSTAAIARAFVVREKAMEQRLTRARKRAAGTVRELGTPSLDERAARLDAVMTMVYLLFNEGYATSHGEQPIRETLCGEAIRLARLLLELYPSLPELMGLLSLCLLQHSRWRARVDAYCRLVPLDQQDRALWNGEMIAEGRGLIEKALRKQAPGPYQLQAAIAATHCAAARAADTDWGEIDRFYALLEVMSPSPIVTMNRAIATAHLRGPADGLAMLEPLLKPLQNYVHFHAARGALLLDSGRQRDARHAFQSALDLQPNDAEAQYLRHKLEEVSKQDFVGKPAAGQSEG